MKSKIPYWQKQLIKDNIGILTWNLYEWYINIYFLYTVPVYPFRVCVLCGKHTHTHTHMYRRGLSDLPLLVSCEITTPQPVSCTYSLLGKLGLQLIPNCFYPPIWELHIMFSFFYFLPLTSYIALENDLSHACKNMNAIKW